jgi:2-isopropylmalate synthase
MVKVGGKVEHTAATGVGPVNALDSALRKALEKFYPKLADMRLNDYKVRVLPGKEGTAAKVRVLIESMDREGGGCVGHGRSFREHSRGELVGSGRQHQL